VLFDVPTDVALAAAVVWVATLALVLVDRAQVQTT
jgi:hypothetical protein